MNQFEKIKKRITIEITKIVKSKEYIISSTIVGSFMESDLLSGISDIDVVIIVDKLMKRKFNEIINSFERINSYEMGLDEYNIIVNNTFGPLKFDSNKNIVFHVMIYDIKGHIKHVQESPFTCYSWEKNKPLHGMSLKEIYPVINLQYSDILDSRRSVLSYLDDIEKGSITFRKYQFKNEKSLIVKDYFHLDSKHRLEYSYHITYHLLNNFYKIITQETTSLKNEEIVDFYKDFEIFSNANVLLFKELYFWKKKGGSNPLNVIDRTKSFINNFFSFIEKIKISSNIISFRRHEKTVLNDGTFLGIKRNPSIYSISKKLSNLNYDIGYHSELKRSKETIKYYNCERFIESSLLNEINYGLVEGLSLDQLSEKYPNIILSWKEGKDPNFPEGENQKDVLIRVKEFLNKKLNNNKNSIIVTHLAVLRLVLFNYLELNLKDLYKIQINHLKGFDILSFKNYFSIRIPSELRIKIRKQLSLLND